MRGQAKFAGRLKRVSAFRAAMVLVFGLVAVWCVAGPDADAAQLGHRQSVGETRHAQEEGFPVGQRPVLGGAGQGSRSSSCVGDIDGDGDVDLADLAEFLGAYGTCVGDPDYNPAADFDDSGCVDISDLAAILGDYGNTCPVADLDIDSDNTNGTGLPDRSGGEDGIEDETDRTGKFVLVNNDDDDRDGTPDKDQDGRIAEEQDDLVPVVFEIRPDDPGTLFADFQLTYPATVRIWRFATRGDLATDVVPSGVTQEYDVAAGPLTLWVEGLSPSATMADTRIVADADTDDDGIFDQSDAVRCTVFSLTGSPTSGPIGTEVVWTLDPAIAPVAFDAGTAAEWDGYYQPALGDPSNQFTVTYAPSQFRESSASEAAVVVGDGSGVPTIPIEGAEPGTFLGHFTIVLAEFEVRRAFSFSVPASAIDWYRVEYPEDEIGYLDEPPVLSAAPVDQLLVYEVPVGGAVPEFLELAYSFHTACVLLLAENGPTLAEAPAAFVVDLITFDSNNVEVDRISDVVLTRASDDGDPSHLTYHSDLATPIVFVDQALDPGMFPNLLLLVAPEGGQVIAIESQP